MLNSFMRHTQHWTLLRYTNTAGILIHFCLANYNAKRLVYNLGFMKYGEKVRECRELIASFMESLKPQFRLSPTGLQLELLPALYTIIQPFCTLVRTFRNVWIVTSYLVCDPTSVLWSRRAEAYQSNCWSDEFLWSVIFFFIWQLDSWHASWSVSLFFRF